MSLAAHLSNSGKQKIKINVSQIRENPLNFYEKEDVYKRTIDKETGQDIELVSLAEGIKEKGQMHNIVVYASDAAGNGAKTANADKPANVVNIDDFYVTTNKWVQYINNKPLFYGSIIAVIAVVGLGVFAVTFVRRKKDKVEK